MPPKATATHVNVLTAEGSDSIIDQIVENTQVNLEQLERIETRLARYREEEASFGELMKAVARAQMIHDLADAITPFMPLFMKLKNSKLGFLTDEATRKEPYTLEQVRDCIVDALLMGLHPIGNEFNIIAENMYPAKDGLWRLCNQLPGVSDFQTYCDPPAYDDGARKVVVIVWAKYLRHGEECKVNYKIPIRINRGMGDDAIIGKATRKIMMLVYTKETGRLIATSDIDDDGTDDEPKTKSASDLISGGKAAEAGEEPKKEGKPSAKKEEPKVPDLATAEQYAVIEEWRETLEWSKERLSMRVGQHFEFKVGMLTKDQAQEVITWLKEQAENG